MSSKMKEKSNRLQAKAEQDRHVGRKRRGTTTSHEEEEEDEATADYSLRRRGSKKMKTASKAKNLKGDDKTIFYGTWSVPQQPAKHVNAFKGLSKGMITADFRAIKETMEADILEDQSVLLGSQEDYAASLIKKNAGESSSSSSKTDEVSKGKGKAKKIDYFNPADEPSTGRVQFNHQTHQFTGTSYLGTRNFYYPFKKMKEREELKDYLDFVNEQKYNSLRYAFVEKMEMLRIKREQQQEALEALAEQYEEEIRSNFNTQAAVKGSDRAMQSALTSLKHYKERCDLLEQENERLRATLKNYGGEVAEGQMETSSANERSGKGRKRGRKENSGMEGESLEIDDEGETVELSEADEYFCDLVLNMRYVNTSFGPGIVQEVRVDGFIVVKLVWGATAFLNLDSFSSASLANCARSDRAIQAVIRKLLVPGYARSFSEGDQNEENHRPIVLFTRTDSGPPRGVPLRISSLSDEAHFAIPEKRPIDPRKLSSLYKLKNVLISNDIADEMEDLNADFDLRERKRLDSIKEIPFAWSAPEALPWGGYGEDLPAEAVDAWERDRSDCRFAQSDVAIQARELEKNNRLVRLKEKRLSDGQKLQQRLLRRLVDSQGETCMWRHKCARLLHDERELLHVDGKSIKDDETRASNSPVPNLHTPRKGRAEMKRRSSANGGDEMEVDSQESGSVANNVGDGSEEDKPKPQEKARGPGRGRKKRSVVSAPSPKSSATSNGHGRTRR